MPRKIEPKAVGVLILGLSLAACGAADNTLSGSIGGTFSLDFDTVQVRGIATSYKIIYTRGPGTESIAETVADLIYTRGTGVSTLFAAQVLPLDFSAAGNAALTRATHDGAGQDFPKAKSGNLTFDVDLPANLPVGTFVRGHFGVLFLSGSALSGTFSAPFAQATQ